jgi:hypothetical protein
MKMVCAIDVPRYLQTDDGVHTARERCWWLSRGERKRRATRRSSHQSSYPAPSLLRAAWRRSLYSSIAHLSRCGARKKVASDGVRRRGAPSLDSRWNSKRHSASAEWERHAQGRRERKGGSLCSSGSADANRLVGSRASTHTTIGRATTVFDAR